MRDSQAERALLLEIDYTGWDVSCRDPHLALTEGYAQKLQLVECRRQHGHEGTHATRAGNTAIIWDQDASPEKKEG